MDFLFLCWITFGRLISGFLTIKWSSQSIIRIGQGLIAVGLLLIFLIPSSLELQLGIFCMGLGCAPIFPSLLRETPYNFGSKYSQSIMVIQMASAYIGTMIIQPLFGIISEIVGYELFPYFLSVLLVIMIYMSELLHKRVMYE